MKSDEVAQLSLLLLVTRSVFGSVPDGILMYLVFSFGKRFIFTTLIVDVFLSLTCLCEIRWVAQLSFLLVVTRSVFDSVPDGCI